MFKGLNEEEVDSSVKDLIKEVDLELDYKKSASRLSGGMKRRCSLAMALTGNPKIIFLDEPSSGLDPVKRRHFWSLVKKVTQEKAVLLTTHLMEEADTLCSEIAIVTTGKMRCVGNSIYLKKTFTEGIKIQIVLNHEVCTTGKFMKAIKKKLKGVKLDQEFQGTLTLIVKDDDAVEYSPSRKQSVSGGDIDSEATSQSSDIGDGEDFTNADDLNSDGNKLSSIFQTMQEFIKTSDDTQPMVNDWSISLGSLEDVFLNVVKTYRENNVE
jgi:ABC-type multidrug transport system ATPase subunit